MSNDTPLKVAVIADAHIDHGHHGLWAIDAWKKSIREIITRECSALVIAGDMFKDGKPAGAALDIAAKGFRVLGDAGIPVVFVVGNHELINVGVGDKHRAAVNVFHHLADWVTVTARPAIIDVSDKTGVHKLKLVSLPWPSKAYNGETQGEASNRMAEELRTLGWDGPVLAVAHAEITGTLPTHFMHSSERDMRQPVGGTAELSDLDIPDVFCHTAMGHIHKRQNLSDTCSYVGSPERFTFIDANDTKGFSIFTWNENRRRWDDELIPTGGTVFKELTVKETRDTKIKIDKKDVIRVKLGKGETVADINRERIDKGGALWAGVKLPKIVETTENETDNEHSETHEPLEDVNIINVGAEYREWMENRERPAELIIEAEKLLNEHLGIVAVDYPPYKKPESGTQESETKDKTHHITDESLLNDDRSDSGDIWAEEELIDEDIPDTGDVDVEETYDEIFDDDVPDSGDIWAEEELIDDVSEEEDLY